MAEVKAFGSVPDAAWQQDHAACEYAERWHRDAFNVDTATAEAERLLSAAWPAVEALATALERSRIVEGAEAERIIRGALTAQQATDAAFARFEVNRRQILQALTACA